MTDSVDLVSGMQHSDLVIQIATLFFFFFSYRLSQNVEQDSLRSRSLPVICLIHSCVCVCSFQALDLSLLPHLSSLVTPSLSLISVSLFLFCK